LRTIDCLLFSQLTKGFKKYPVELLHGPCVSALKEMLSNPGIYDRLSRRLYSLLGIECVKVTLQPMT
jgi:hypothetical protein